MNTNGSSQAPSKNAIVQPPPTPNVHMVVPPPPGVGAIPSGGQQRIHFQPQTIQKNGTTTTLTNTPQFANNIRSPIKSTTTTLSGNITLNTNANVAKVVPKTPPRQNFTSFAPLMNFPFSPGPVGAINNPNNRAPKHTISLAHLQTQIQQLPPMMPAVDEEANKKRKLNGGEPSRINTNSVINLDDENSNTSNASSDTPSTPLDSSEPSRKRKRNETNGTGGRGCSCKKTGCLKRYCECFQNNRRCTENCNCQGCKNYDGSTELATVMDKQSSGKKKNITQPVNPPPLPRTKIVKPPTTVPSVNTPNRNYYPPMPMPLVGVTNLFDVVAGPDAIVELCKRLLLTTHRQEQIYSQQWQTEQRKKVPENRPLSPNEEQKTPPRAPPRSQVTPPKTSPPSRPGIEASPETLSLLCDEDDALHGAAATTSAPSDPRPSSKTFMQHVTASSHKGFEHSLQVALEDAVLQEFSHFLRDKLDQYYVMEQSYGQQFSLSPIKRR
jgi:hypothetical protein